MKKIFYILLVVFAVACQDKTNEIKSDTLFTLLPSEFTNIDFENTVENSDPRFNIFTYRNYYNGGGVAICDVNNDGLPDIYLTANMKANKLFLNKGNFKFEDITQKAGVEGKKAWSTGVSVADVNGDGLLDIYVCNSGNAAGDDKANELFINQGNDSDGVPTFKEMAKEYGLADEGFSTHAAFFDYDHDGDLDLYLLNNSFRPISSFGLENIRHIRDSVGGDKLFQNNNGKFVDVSEKAGIFGSVIGFGLGVTVGDVNNDGWFDIYVSNDFFERDYLYINNQNGTFSESLEKTMRHISVSSMGADMADINNDARPEIFVTDMLPETDRRIKTVTSYDSYDVYHSKLKNDYYHQFMRNMLHLNLPSTKNEVVFSEIGQLSQVDATDWSWGALIWDMDNDGMKDIFVSNGIYKDLTNQDFIDFFANDQHIKELQKGKAIDYSKILDQIPSTPIPNYAFQNQGNLKFVNQAKNWGLDKASFSNGAAYGDLDGDGDLDLVVNNVNQNVFVYRNESNAKTENNYLKIKLLGEKQNLFGIGAKVYVKANGQTFYQEQMPMRGFQSTVDYVLNFGLGKTQSIDSVIVEWTNQQFQVIKNVKSNQVLSVSQKDATQKIIRSTDSPENLFFVDQSKTLNIDFKHQENDFVDFNRENLMPHKLSTEGAKIAKADVNGDGLEDFYVGGAKEQAGKLFIQSKNGTFTATNQALFEIDKISEDVGIAFFDADGDKDMDLYVVSGGNDFSDDSPALQDRLYLNDGRGNFKKSKDQIPMEYSSGSCVQPADFDGDGDMDLFVASRGIAWKYGIAPKHFLLQNNGKGIFTDVTAQFIPDLQKLGMITDAIWIDYDQDKKLDLIIVGEWLPITLYKNTGKTFENISEKAGFAKTNGWWNTIIAEDFDNDGDLDLVAGNLGLNNRIRASESEPATMYVSDFDKNGNTDQILCYYKQGKSYPMPLRDDLVLQIPSLKKKYLKYTDYAEKQITDIFSQEQLDKAELKTAYTFAHAFFENNGDGTFKKHDLPLESQFSCVYGMLAQDVDGDGFKDLVLTGNFHSVKPEIGNYDGSYGVFLKGNGKNGFQSQQISESGLLVTGQARDMISLKVGNKNMIFIAKNNDPLQVFEIRTKK